MGKTTNILDLNNRLSKVEKENVAQNNYNSLKNRPKINGNLLTGDKTGAQLGLADAQDITDINTDIGDMSDLGTTATDLVGGINEVNGKLNQISLGEITATDEHNFVSQVLTSLAALDLPENVTKAFDVSYSGVSLFSGLAEWVSSTVLFIFLFRSGYQYTASYNSSTQSVSVVKYTGTTVSPT